MYNLLIQLANYLSYPFVRYALITGILISLCASLLGVTLVLKRYSFMGDGLSHTAFGAMAVAAVLHISQQILVVLPVTVLCAIFLLKRKQNARVKGDAALAMVSVSAMALGYLLLNLFSPSANIAGDVCSSLFGSTSILTLSRQDVAVCLLMSAMVLTVVVLFYHKIFALTFDETFAKATGVNTDGYNLLIATVTAVIIVLAMNLVGALLTSALIIFPALSAMRIFHSFRRVIISAGMLSVFCATVGILLSILASTPVGATIVLVDLLCFFLCMGIGRTMGR